MYPVTPLVIENTALPIWNPEDAKRLFICGVNETQNCAIGIAGTHNKVCTPAMTITPKPVVIIIYRIDTTFFLLYSSSPKIRTLLPLHLNSLDSPISRLHQVDYIHYPKSRV